MLHAMCPSLLYDNNIKVLHVCAILSFLNLAVERVCWHRQAQSIAESLPDQASAYVKTKIEIFRTVGLKVWKIRNSLQTFR
jgi:hypothetical protein